MSNNAVTLISMTVASLEQLIISIRVCHDYPDEENK